MVDKLRPMLAASFEDPQHFEVELERLRFPLLGSPKVDGIRWMKPPSESAKSRSWTDLPNRAFQEFMSLNSGILDFLDGEVITGDDITLPGLFNKTQSHIMSRDGDTPFTLYVFDWWFNPTKPFDYRTHFAREIVEHANHPQIKYLPHQQVDCPGDILYLEEEALKAGYEGIMLRDPRGEYKYGRSTLKQQGLIKVKRFADDEAQIIGFEALQRNLNEPTRDSFGLQKRSSHKANKVEDNLLGKLLVRSERWGEFAIGSGFDEASRIEIWNNQADYLGKTVCFKYQAHGSGEKPRIPTWKGLRKD